MRLIDALRRCRLVALALPLSLLALGAGGCKKYPNCKKQSDCQAGESCVDGLCQNCVEDAECVAKTPAGQAPWTCNNFRCGPPTADGAAGGGEEGDPCTQRSECLGGLTCKAGKCALCSDDLDCAPGTCNFESGRCNIEGAACSTDEDCAMDEICDANVCIFSGDLGDENGGPCGLAAVYFAFDSDELTPKSQEELASIAGCMAEQGMQVFLEAHADDRGTEEYNILLTERRGVGVKKFLVDQGVNGELLQVIAKGDLEAQGKDEAARAKDRRVQFIWPAGSGGGGATPATDGPANDAPAADDPAGRGG